MIFFTSDEHVDHANVIKFCKRPFADVEEMAEGLISRHNEVVKPGDLVFHLGDMFWRTVKDAKALEYRLRLNGQHYYIRGNHEEALDRNPGLQRTFEWIRDLELIHPKGYPYIQLCHYAMRVWNKSHNGSWQLYGHSHNELENNPDRNLLSFDVGVDSWNYYPVSIEQVAEKMKERTEFRSRTKVVCPECSRSFYPVNNAEKLCADCGVVMKSVLTEGSIA